MSWHAEEEKVGLGLGLLELWVWLRIWSSVRWWLVSDSHIRL
jgi:hypothetical protein